MATVNRGWQMAIVCWSVIVNSDDPVKPGFLKTVVNFMNKNQEVIVGYPDWDMIDEKGKILKTKQVREGDMIEMIVLHRCNPRGRLSGNLPYLISTIYAIPALFLYPI